MTSTAHQKIGSGGVVQMSFRHSFAYILRQVDRCVYPIPGEPVPLDPASADRANAGGAPSSAVPRTGTMPVSASFNEEAPANPLTVLRMPRH